MKFKKESYFKSYFYLFILSIAISLSAFSCNESEEIILETQPEPLLMKFVNQSNYDLSEFQMNSIVQLPNLAVGEETDFTEMDVYTYPYKVKIATNKFEDFVKIAPRRICGNEDYTPITTGKYTAVLTVELGYTDWDFSGQDYIEPYECLFLFVNIIEENQ